ncbi:MAG: hypothetical protein Kow00120_21520 [Anaerolineae bacterium]
MNASRSFVWAGRALLALALVIFVGYLLIYIHYAFALFQFPFDYDQGEGFELYDTLLFSRGEWPYRENETYPFYASNYPPLFHVIAAPLVHLFGPQYWIGRALGFAGTLVNAAVIAYAVYREVPRRAIAAPIAGTIAALAALAFLASNTVYHVGPLFRQHMFMVMWETLAVVILARSRDWRGLALGGLCLVAAGYTKQLAVISIAAAFLFLFLRNPKRAFIWGAGVAAVGAAIFLWIDASTGGQWWLNTVAANVNQYIPGQARDLYLQWFGLHGALIIPAALLALYELYFDRLSIYSVWFAVATVGAALSGKWGAGDSYFATAIAAMCILAGIFAARTWAGDWRFEPNYITRLARRIVPRRAAPPAGEGASAPRAARRLGYVLVPVIFLTYALAVRHMPTEGPVFGPLSRALRMEANTGFAFFDSAGWVVGYARLGQIPTEADHAAGWRIVSYIEATEQPVLSEEAGFMLAAGREVVSNPTQLQNLYFNGLYDPTALIDMISAQAFAHVIYRAQFYPPPVLEAVAAAYAPVDTIPMNGFEYVILAPKDQAARE